MLTVRVRRRWTRVCNDRTVATRPAERDSRANICEPREGSERPRVVCRAYVLTLRIVQFRTHRRVRFGSGHVGSQLNKCLSHPGTYANRQRTTSNPRSLHPGAFAFASPRASGASQEDLQQSRHRGGDRRRERGEERDSGTCRRVRTQQNGHSASHLVTSLSQRTPAVGHRRPVQITFANFRV